MNWLGSQLYIPVLLGSVEETMGHCSEVVMWCYLALISQKSLQGESCPSLGITIGSPCIYAVGPPRLSQNTCLPCAPELSLEVLVIWYQSKVVVLKTRTHLNLLNILWNLTNIPDALGPHGLSFFFFPPQISGNVIILKIILLWSAFSYVFFFICWEFAPQNYDPGQHN